MCKKDEEVTIRWGTKDDPPMILLQEYKKNICIYYVSMCYSIRLGKEEKDHSLPSLLIFIVGKLT